MKFFKIYFLLVAIGLQLAAFSQGLVIMKKDSLITYTSRKAIVDTAAALRRQIPGIDHPGLVSGGIVTTNRLLKIDISPAVYYINGLRYTTNADSATLANADGSFARFDLVVADTTGHVVVHTGTPASNPITPQINPRNEVFLAYIKVPALATSLAPASNILIYDENVEFAVGSYNLGTIVPDDTQHPYSGTKDLLIGPFTDGDQLSFNRVGRFNIGLFQALKFRVRLKAAMPYATYMQVAFYQTSGNVTVSTPVSITSQYGFNGNVVNQWLTVVVPITEFSFTDNSVDAFRFQFTGSNTDSIFFDKVELLTTLSSGNNTGNFVTHVNRHTGTDSVFEIINGVEQFAFKDSSGGAEIAGGTTNKVTYIPGNATYNVTSTDTHIYVYQSNTGTIALPPASSNTGRKINISIIETQSQHITPYFIYNGTDTFNYQYGPSCDYISDGVHWRRADVSPRYSLSHHFAATGAPIIAGTQDFLADQTTRYVRFKGIISGPGIIITNGTNDLTITATGGGGGLQKVYAGTHLANTNDSTLNADSLANNLRNEIATKQNTITNLGDTSKYIEKGDTTATTDPATNYKNNLKQNIITNLGDTSKYFEKSDTLTAPQVATNFKLNVQSPYKKDTAVMKISGLNTINYFRQLNQFWGGYNGFIIRFNNPNNLLDQDTIKITGFNPIDIIYIASKNKVYACANNDPGSAIEINPVTLAYTEVVHANTSGNVWTNFQGMAFNDTQFFVSGYNDQGATIIKKYSLTDFSVIDTVNLVNNKYGFGIRIDSSYLYTVTDIADPTKCSIVKLNTVTNLYDSVNLYITETGEGPQFAMTPKKIIIPNASDSVIIFTKENMALERLYVGGPTKGAYWDGEYVWVVRSTTAPRTILRINPNTKEIISYTYSAGENGSILIASDGQRVVVPFGSTITSISMPAFTKSSISTTLPDGQINIGQRDNIAKPVTIGGDIAINRDGVATINSEKLKAGSYSQVGTATTTFTVTFGGTQPNATYKVVVTPTAALSAALFYVTNKTTTTFNVMYLAGLTGTVTFDWVLTQ